MVGDPRNGNSDAIADDVVRRLFEVFGPMHAFLRQEVTTLSSRLTKIEARLDQIEATAGARLDEIEHKTGFNIELARAAAANAAAAAPPVPAPMTARPAAIDRACSADPTDGPVMALVPELGRDGLEIEPEPGSDPEGIWPKALHAIQTAGSSGGRKHRR